jgi:hypothetical protein
LQKQTKSVEPGTKRRKYMYFEQMLFLIPQTQDRATSSNYSPMTVSNVEEDTDERREDEEGSNDGTAEIYTCRKKQSERNKRYSCYGRSIGSWICLTHKTYTCHTVQNTIRYDVRFTGMKVRYTIFERVTTYNNAKRTLRKLQRFISTVILL